MHPALSVIFFTTLSGAGYGLLAWTAVALFTSRVPWGVLALASVLGAVLAAIGLGSSVFHLGKPLRAWRAFSQWRTSWLSREGVLALATFVPTLAFAWLAWARYAAGEGSGVTPWLALAAVAMALLALATVGCTAMIYASLKPIPAWRHPLVVPVYVLHALLTGGLLLATLDAATQGGLGRVPAVLGLWLAFALWVAKRHYWAAIDAPLPLTRGQAVGLPGREATVFERPHTEANYLTREMGFVVARTHARQLRLLAVLLFAILPMVLLLSVWLVPALWPAPWYGVAAAGALAGAFVERWLFFAQARHVVTLYY